MSKNFLQQGMVLDILAPATVLSSASVLLGSMFGIALHDAASGAKLRIGVQGVFTATKVASQAVAVGDKLYYNGTALTGTAGTAKEVGLAASATGAGAGETLIDILLVPTVRDVVTA